MPDIDRKDQTEASFIPVCARNLESNKQDCRLQAKYDDARKWYQKKFRYVDMKVDSPGLPRTVTTIKFCQ